MRFFPALPLIFLASFTMASDQEILVFGASYHQDTSQHFNAINPGLGYTHAFPFDRISGAILSAGTYLDSYGKLAAFAMPGVRVHNERFSGDVSVGWFHGSGFTGIGFMPSAGIKVTHRLWLNFSGAPTPGKSFVAAFIRWEL